MSGEAVEYVRGIPVVKMFQQTVYSFKAFYAAIQDYSNLASQYAMSCRTGQTCFLTFINGAFALLIPAALLVWWPLWFLFMGALMSQEELRLTIGPALGLGTGYTVWHLLPDWPTLEPLLTLLLDTPQFFVMFWNSIGQSVAQVAGNLLVGAPAALGNQPGFAFRGRSMVSGAFTSF